MYCIAEKDIRRDLRTPLRHSHCPEFDFPRSDQVPQSLKIVDQIEQVGCCLDAFASYTLRGYRIFQPCFARAIFHLVWVSEERKNLAQAKGSARSRLNVNVYPESDHHV